MVAVASFEGNVRESEANLSLGLFIDERANKEQRDALALIFSGKAGGFMGKFAKSVGELRGIEFVPIHFEIADDLAYWKAEIPNRVTAMADALSGPTTPPGARVQMTNAPGSEVGPGQIVTWGKTTENHVRAYGFEWHWAEKSSKHIPFDWSGPK